ncbi:TatD family deoxyribonuclease [Candidatus Thorarchaeota archaeon]|nr:MAG: TatD family deoxyribonuclease [Candidatus Thorarchaeota archaeon]
MRLFDSHTHLDMKHYKHDLDHVLERAVEAGVVGMVTSSIGPGSFRRTLGIVRKYPKLVYHTAGTSVSRLTSEETDEIILLARKYQDEIVAVGEVGLDYHWVKDDAGRRAQEPLLKRFIDLAQELELPLVIHSRKAEAEATGFIEKRFDGPVLMHCFEGPPDVARHIRDNGWSITLPANFSKYRRRVEAAQILPIEQILLETDGPYLSPVEGRNEPANIVYGCESLADILGQDVESVAEQTTRNAVDFYNIELSNR